MDLSIYLAFTGVEAEAVNSHRAKTAWFGCRLSPYGAGIISTSSAVKSCDMLILTDETPIAEHDPQQVAAELVHMANSLGCEKLLIDFQRQPTVYSSAIIKEVLRRSPVPTGVSDLHAKELLCPVFLSAPPLWDSLEDHIAPWKGREIWLEAATDAACVTVSKSGSAYRQSDPIEDHPHFDSATCTAYAFNMDKGTAYFHLRRGKSELMKLLDKATDCSIQTVIGLYQQLKDFP